jgi:ClpP class serine protease
VLDGNYEPYQKNVLDVINSKFLTSIKTNRPAVDDSTLTGKIYFAPQAIALGLIDEIGSLDYAISVSSDLSPGPIELSKENETNNQKNMKIKETWKSIQSFFKMDPADLEAQELTTERVQQLNDELGNVITLNQELETLLSDEQQSHAATKAELLALQQEDAATPIVTVKDADKIESGPDEPVYAHDKIADEFCS